MKNNLLSLLLVLAFSACQQQESETPITQSEEFEMLDPSFFDYFKKGDTLEVLAEGFNWSEGPVWVDEMGGFLLFSDVPENKIYKWAEGEGKSVYLDPSGYTAEGKREGSNGLLLDNEGRLILCQHGDRRVARLGASFENPSPAYETVADRYDLKRFNSPNDACIDKEGNIYFTDPPYGLPQKAKDSTREIPFCGVYKVDPQGQVTLLVDSLTRPNGIALSADESVLYVANSDPKKAWWVEYQLTEEKALTRGRVILDVTDMVGKENPGLPDGLRVHPDGTIFGTGPGGVLLISPEGRHLGTIRTGQATANCTFGNEGKYLYMTADMYLMRVAINK